MHTEDKLMLKIIIAVFAFIVIVALAETAGAADGYQPHKNSFDEWVKQGTQPQVPQVYEWEQLRQQNKEMQQLYNQEMYTIYDFKTNTYKFCQQNGSNIICY